MPSNQTNSLAITAIALAGTGHIVGSHHYLSGVANVTVPSFCFILALASLLATITCLLSNAELAFVPLRATFTIGLLSGTGVFIGYYFDATSSLYNNSNRIALIELACLSFSYFAIMLLPKLFHDRSNC